MDGRKEEYEEEYTEIKKDPLGYEAYTQPLNSERYIYSPQSPVASVNYTQHKEKKHGKLVAGLIIVALAVGGAGAYVSANYNVSFAADGNGINFSMISKDGGLTSERPIEQTPPENTPDSDPVMLQAPETMLPMAWDGTELEVQQKGEEQLSYQQIFKKCSKSVVSIFVESAFSSCSGTGIIMSDDGYIITNDHVIDSDGDITVTLSSGREYKAVVVGGDEASDLAVLKIEAFHLEAADFGISTDLEVGDSVVVIGNPFDQSLSMSNGIISAINRNVLYNGYNMTLLQTNAAINEGNSGGALINMYGQVIGITNMKMTSYYSTIEGIGFAIPISTAKPIIDELLAKGYVSGRPAIGIVPAELSPAAIAYYRLPDGVYIASVYEGTDAYNKGITKGDIITAINGYKVNSMNSLNEKKNLYKAGDSVTLTIYRTDFSFDVNVVLADAAEIS